MLLLIKSRVCNIMLIRAPTPVDLATEEENVGKAEETVTKQCLLRIYIIENMVNNVRHGKRRKRVSATR